MTDMPQFDQNESRNAETIYRPLKRLSSIAGMDILAAAKTANSEIDLDGNVILWEIIFYLIFLVDLAAFKNNQSKETRQKLQSYILMRANEEENAYPKDGLNRLEQFCLVRLESYGQVARNAETKEESISYTLALIDAYIGCGWSNGTMCPETLTASGDHNFPVVLLPSGAVLIGDIFHKMWIMEAFLQMGLLKRIDAFIVSLNKLFSSDEDFLHLSESQLEGVIAKAGWAEWLDEND